MFEAADRVIVVSDGRLSAPLTVAEHAHVEALATEVTRLERHGRGGGSLALPTGHSCAKPTPI